MVDQEDGSSGKREADADARGMIHSSDWTGTDGNSAEENPEVARQPKDVGGGDGGNGRYLWPRLTTPEWVSALASVAAVIVAALSVGVAYQTRVVLDRQLEVMKSGGQDTKNLVSATWGLVRTGNAQAGAMNKLQQAGSAQATAMDRLRKAGETQASAMDKLRIAGEAQAAATENLADAGRTQAAATRNLADNSARQLGAIQASADAARSQADAVRKQADATIAASQATDRLANAGQAQSAAVLQSLDVARAANDIASHASQAADRPWISISMPGDIEPTAGQDYKIDISVLNVGRSPAVNATANIDIKVIQETDTFSGILDKCPDTCQRFTVFPTNGAFQATTTGYHLSLPASTFTPNEVERVIDRHDTILLRIRVDYQDSAGTDHVTSECESLVPKLGYTSCLGGNVAN